MFCCEPHWKSLHPWNIVVWCLLRKRTTEATDQSRINTYIVCSSCVRICIRHWLLCTLWNCNRCNGQSMAILSGVESPQWTSQYVLCIRKGCIITTPRFARISTITSCWRIMWFEIVLAQDTEISFLPLNDIFSDNWNLQSQICCTPFENYFQNTKPSVP